jgi:hypothetical protein
VSDVSSCCVNFTPQTTIRRNASLDPEQGTGMLQRKSHRLVRRSPLDSPIQNQRNRTSHSGGEDLNPNVTDHRQCEYKAHGQGSEQRLTKSCCSTCLTARCFRGPRTPRAHFQSKTCLPSGQRHRPTIPIFNCIDAWQWRLHKKRSDVELATRSWAKCRDHSDFLSFCAEAAVGWAVREEMQAAVR